MLTPYMPQNEIAMMDAIIALKRPARVLEFGAGGSTVRWSGSSGVVRWVAIEHDMEWYRKVSGWTPPGVHLRMASSESAQSYIEPVLGYGGRFDLIFVDGLHRVECIKASPQFLAPHGVVILHDASRTEYAEAWDVYPHRAMLTKGNGCRNGLMLMWGDG
jgi:predicted O-methyltransferase YrrM